MDFPTHCCLQQRDLFSAEAAPESGLWVLHHVHALDPSEWLDLLRLAGHGATVALQVAGAAVELVVAVVVAVESVAVVQGYQQVGRAMRAVLPPECADCEQHEPAWGLRSQTLGLPMA
eukprot:741520-Amphidinium_carterae.1